MSKKAAPKKKALVNAARFILASVSDLLWPCEPIIDEEPGSIEVSH